MKTIFHRFHKFSAVPLQSEGEMLESVLFLEDMTRACFQSINEQAHNGNVRRECQLFSKEAMLSQNQLKGFLKDEGASQGRLEQMRRNQGVDLSCFSLLGAVEAALRYALQKWNIYKYLLSNTEGVDSAKALAQALGRTWKEIKFLKNEEKYQKNKEEEQSSWSWPVAAAVLP